MSNHLVGVLGDTHGNTAAARFMLWSMHRMGIQRVIHVGDFGIYTDNNGMKFASKVNQYAQEFGITLIVVPGNHENWRIINEMVGEDRENLAAYRSNIFIAPRGYRWEWNGMSFLALGGAPSVDRTWRLQLDKRSKDKYKANQLWYPEEQITGADVDYVKAGGYADVMIGHDAPHGIQGIERVIKGNPHGFHVADLLYAEEGRLLMTEAFRGVAPEFFFHGHYHTPVNENIQRPGGEYGEITHVIGLDCEFNNYSMAVIDTETRTARNIDHYDLLMEFRNELNGKST
ncbi:phosphatase [Microbacterium phage Zooman]|nr:phosphatase [Microbacterium phage Zooman]